ncbi:complement C4-B [Cololabis saira]|uniref:complement C4-B n=1 Tax=Cololabis saira TaxID=129043 RepID=UPI002AD200B3|nr:complement C4-B [Cololabis saira]
MKSHIVLLGLLLLILAVEDSVEDRFFISAPNVFHLGVREKVFVQVGAQHLNKPVTLHLEHETSGILMSTRKTVTCTPENRIQTVELMINKDSWSEIPEWKTTPPYLLLVTMMGKDRYNTRVLVSPHRGYIFIQTDQPIYNPIQTVRYRIFTLDHMFRPQVCPFHISIFNADGNRLMKSFKTPSAGMLTDSFTIPTVSKMGMWKITAHYEDDEENAAVREFKVEKFVLPSFEVKIAAEQRYVLLTDTHLNFTVSALYSHGEKVDGSYHCKFGVVKRGGTGSQKMNPEFITGLEMAGSVKDGSTRLSLQLEMFTLKLKEQLNQTLADLLEHKSQLYLGVFVTNIQSREIQEGEVHLPIISQKYILDLSRTRSHFVPGYPVDIVVVLRLPDGSSAAGVQINIEVEGATREAWNGVTDPDGGVFYSFNINSEDKITVDVSADGLQERKNLTRFSSPSGSFLHLTFTNKVYDVGDLFSFTFNTKNAPSDGHIYYMVLSRGITIETGSYEMGISIKSNSLPITAKMVPSFRVIGYYYSASGDIIADSIWVDVRDECEIKVKIDHRGSGVPGRTTDLQFDLHGQAAKVALLAVDKAIYSLNVDNKLTKKQVFSAMNSHDLGCSYGGGSDSASALLDAGLAFVSQSSSNSKKGFGCNSQTSRKRRSVIVQQEIEKLKSDFPDAELQNCCSQAVSPIPMRRTCQERAARVHLVRNNQTCTDAFLKCCLAAEKLKHKIKLEEAMSAIGRTANTEDIEQFFSDTTEQYIRRYFPPSFAFSSFDVNNKGSYSLPLPDSITTWEIQVVTLSPETGFCVVKPYEIKAFKKAFVSLRLPYSVKKFEQVALSPVIYNYGDEVLKVAVNMEQTEGLCSPVSATPASYVKIDVAPQSSKSVLFTAVPMVSGSIPIKILVYDIEREWGLDAIEKKLEVKTEGLEQRVEETHLINFEGRSARNFSLDGTLPDNTVPESNSNVFVSAEGVGLASSNVETLLSPERLSGMIVLPTGCLEQTIGERLAPLALVLRYLDLSQRWFDVSPSDKDDALDKIEKGLMHMRDRKFKDESSGAYGSFRSVPSSNWVTALVVKVLSLVAERERPNFGERGRSGVTVDLSEIRHPVSYLLSIQNMDGSFSDPHPVVMNGREQAASMTAFITLALNRSLPFLTPESQTKAQSSISAATKYLQLQLPELRHTYAVAITAYCLSTCLPGETSGWTKLQSMVKEDKNGCYMWAEDSNADHAITIETTAYALLAALEEKNITWAEKIACWLTSQENYFKGYKSTQDTIMALEALSEYELKKRPSPETNMKAEFTVPGKQDIVRLSMANKKEKVETSLRKFAGKNIRVDLTGEGDVKIKSVKAFYLLEPKDDCDQLSIKVTVEGKVEYTDKIIENYDYYEEYDTEQDVARVSRSVTEQFDAHTREKRDLENNPSSEVVSYNICVSIKAGAQLTGMTIVDITLLSGFEAEIADLDMLKQPAEQYITHYEANSERVIIYLNKLFGNEECFSFRAKQNVQVGLLQPAPAVFYDYYEPTRRCTVFYSAPKRSKMISKLCSEDVCQCAERPCHELKDTFTKDRVKRIKKNDRAEHACFSPGVDYAYFVTVDSISVKSNFELYKSNVTEVLKTHGDAHVGENSVRVFAKRFHCKGKLEEGKQYLIMGKDGSTKDSSGEIQYLLESNTWIEKKPTAEDCRKSANRVSCGYFYSFVDGYKYSGCKT